MMYNYYHFETDGQWDIGQLRELLESFGMTSDDGHDYDRGGAHLPELPGLRQRVPG